MYLRFFTLVDKAYNDFSSYSSRYNKKAELSVFLRVLPLALCNNDDKLVI